MINLRFWSLYENLGSGIHRCLGLVDVCFPGMGVNVEGMVGEEIWMKGSRKPRIEGLSWWEVVGHVGIVVNNVVTWEEVSGPSIYV